MADPYLTIQAGLNASGVTDDIMVAAGTYNESIFVEGDRRLIGAGASTTIIDGSGTGTFVVNLSGPTGQVNGSLVEGFTITNGLTGPGQQGAGVRITVAKSTIRDCIIDGNDSSQGGGVALLSGAELTIENSTISNNIADGSGGGIYLGNGFLTINDVDFIDNANRGNNPGRVIYANNGTVDMTNCQITGSGVVDVGYAPIYFEAGLVATMTNCTLSDYEGGGLIVTGAGTDLTMTGCVVSNNEHCCNEAGVSVKGGATASITNSTITGNETTLFFGGMQVGGLNVGPNSSVTMTSSIVWNNLVDQIVVDPTATLNVTYSDIQGGWPGAGNIDADPLFTNTVAGDFTLGCPSPAINAGHPSAVYNDPDGSRNDMGAFHTPLPNLTTWYVDGSVPGPGCGTAADPFKKIQYGLNASGLTDDIIVAAGTYNESIFVEGDRQLIGAGAATTIIDGSGTGTFVVDLSGPTGQVNGSLVEGFTITNGLIAGTGAGVRISVAKSTIRDCIITGNASSQGGGVALVFSAELVIENTTISNNTADGSGGALFVGGGFVTLTDVDFIDNGSLSSNPGAVIYAGTGTIDMTDCQVSGNGQPGTGRGAIYIENNTATMTGCTVSDFDQGGVIVNGATADLTMTRCVVSNNTHCCNEAGVKVSNGATANITNSTITGNETTLFFGGMQVGGLNVGPNANVTMTSSIVWNNLVDQIVVDPTATLNVTYSDIQGGWPGAGNIDADPQFANAAAGDYTLLCSSPAVDAGDPDPGFNDPDGSRNDMGAFPASGCSVTISGTVSAQDEFGQECPGGVLGITVDLDHPNTEMLTTSTNASGYYEFADVDQSAYDAVVAIVVPLGYVADTPPDGQTMVPLNQTQTVNFTLICEDPVGEARSMGYWKHQANVYLKGKGHAHETQADMETGYPMEVFNHFHQNGLNAIEVEGVTFLDNGGDPEPLDLATLHATLSVKGNAGMEAKAKQQYLALLLNIASLKLLPSSIVSDDNATASQALQYVACIINQVDCSESLELAKDICDTINNAQLVAAGVIDMGFINIAYSPGIGETPLFVDRPLSVYPNPGGSQPYRFSFSTPVSQQLRLEIYNVAGQRVATISRVFDAGEASVLWYGDADAGSSLKSGVYFARLRTATGMKSVKFVHVR